MIRSSALITVLMALAIPACRDYELQSTFASPGVPYITGVIAQRSSGEMYVVQNPNFYCDSTAWIVFYPGTRVVDAAGTVADTTAFVVGRRVTVWSTGTVEPDCPPSTGAKIIALEN